MPRGESPPAENAGAKPMELVSNDAQFIVEGERFRLAIGRANGSLESYRVDGKELLAAPLRPNFWKIPNDNQYRNRYLERLGVCAVPRTAAN